MKIAAVLTAAAATTTVASGNLLRDPKTIVQKQNDGALTEGQRRLAVSVLMCLLTWPDGAKYASSSLFLLVIRNSSPFF
jgi:hypothetical protein